MRIAVAAAFSALAVVGPGGYASATYRGSTLELALHYPMTCGQPGPGPLVIILPRSFRIANVRVLVQGAQRPHTAAGATVTIGLPKPPQVTCMSIAEGTLAVRLQHVHAPAGAYTVQARVRSRAFTARLHIP